MRRVAARQPEPQRLLAEGLALHLSGRPHEARQVLQRAASSRDVDVRAEALLKLGEISAEQGDVSEARRAFREAAAANPRVALEAGFQEASLVARGDDPADAERLLRDLHAAARTLSEEPPLLLLRVTAELATLMARLHRHDDAMSLMDETATAVPSVAELLTPHRAHLAELRGRS